MPSHRFPAPLALAALIVAAGLAGCVGATDEVRVVKLACVGAGNTSYVNPTPQDPLGSTQPPATYQKVLGGTAFKLGVLLPTTGPSVVDLRRGGELAALQVQTAGINVTLVTETAATASDARAAFERLARDQKVAAVVVALDASRMTGLVDLARETRVPLIASAANDAALSVGQASDGYFWRVPPPDSIEGKALMQLVSDAGCRSAVVVAPDTPHGNAVASAFLEAIHERGGFGRGRVLYTPAGALDPNRVVQSLLDVDAEAVVVIGTPEDAAAIVRAAYTFEPEGRYGLKDPTKRLMTRSVFFFAGDSRDPAFVADVGETAKGTPIVGGLRGTAPGRATTPAEGVFAQSFELRYGGRPSLAAAQAYDAAWIAALAVQCAQSDRGENVATKLPVVANAAAGDVEASGEDPSAALTVARNCNVNYVGAAHDYDFDAYGDPVTGPYSFWVVADDGSLRTIRTTYEP